MKSLWILDAVLLLNIIGCNDTTTKPKTVALESNITANNFPSLPEYDSVLVLEAEDYLDSNGEIRLEEKSNASDSLCVHLGPDNNNMEDGIGDALFYEISSENDFSMIVFEIRYSDEVGGNIIHVYFDERNMGCFTTEGTGGWNNFIIDNQKINLQQLDAGNHTLKLEMTKGGSYGVLLDYFEITEVNKAEIQSGAYSFVTGSINPNTGLVNSAEYNREFTTIYKNALAAMCFIHENDISKAEGIFDFFLSKYDAESFDGFNKNWNPSNGDELGQEPWVGDDAFLLLALNYYKMETESYGEYTEMAIGLRDWLIDQRNDITIAEGLANMFAALKPWENSVAGLDTVLQQIKQKFYDNVDFDFVLDHTVRAALVFSDLRGFGFVDDFKRSEIWKYNGEEIHGFAAFSNEDEDFINVEISAQLLLVIKHWEEELSVQMLPNSESLSYQDELNKLWLISERAPEIIEYGLPYYLNERGWERSWDGSIIDPVTYMLFCEWKFNPWAPGLKGY